MSTKCVKFRKIIQNSELQVGDGDMHLTSWIGDDLWIVILMEQSIISSGVIPTTQIM